MTIFSTLGFGLLLGIKHAFEADHLIAVTTMLHEQKDARRAALVGTFWGIGHTTTLFVVGLIVLVLRVSIPEAIAVRLEGIVGVMLILLGIQAILKKNILHTHSHAHEGESHSHLHTNHHHQHKKSFLIGTIHGLAGSGALMVLVLSLVQSVWEGIVYIALFGIGSTIGMTLMSLFLGVPLSKSLAMFNKTERYVRVGMGIVSIIFGLFVLAEIFQPS